MKNDLAKFLRAFYGPSISVETAAELVSELRDVRPLLALTSHRVGARIEQRPLGWLLDARLLASELDGGHGAKPPLVGI